jgi:hypothetical protein
MQWKCCPIPKDTNGKPAIHYTTVYRGFAKWADDGSLWLAFAASVRHLTAEKHLDLRVLHGDGTNTVAKREDGSGYSGYKHQKGEKVTDFSVTLSKVPRIWENCKTAMKVFEI